MAGKFKMPSIQDIEKVNEEHGGANFGLVQDY